MEYENIEEGFAPNLSLIQESVFFFITEMPISVSILAYKQNKINYGIIYLHCTFMVQIDEIVLCSTIIMISHPVEPHTDGKGRHSWKC